MTQPTTVAPDRDAGELVHRLMSVLDVDRAAVPDSIYQDLRRACAKCKQKPRCEFDLTTGRSQACYQAYCPSAHTLGTLRALQRACRRLSID
jgi:hypothetical protein